MNKKLTQLGVLLMTTATLSTTVFANEPIDADNASAITEKKDETSGVFKPKTDDNGNLILGADKEETTRKRPKTFQPRLDKDGNLILGPDPDNPAPDIHEPDEDEDEEGLENDFRKRVENVDALIHRSVLHLILEYGDYKGEQEGLKDEHCTGTVIGKDTLITAAHCVAGEKRGVVTGGKAILPSKDGHKVFEIDKVLYHPNWKNEKLERYRRFDYDVALVKIKPTADGKHIGEILGTVPINSKAEARVGKMVTNPGYPLDKLEKYGITQWDSIGGRIISEDEYNYKTNHYTRGGQSGSVMLDENKEIIGVLSSGSVDNALFIKMQSELYKWIGQHVDLDEASKLRYDNTRKPENTPKDADKGKNDKKDNPSEKGKLQNSEQSSMVDDKKVNKISSKPEKGRVELEKKLPETGTANGTVFSLLGTVIVGLGFAYRKFIKM